MQFVTDVTSAVGIAVFSTITVDWRGVGSAKGASVVGTVVSVVGIADSGVCVPITFDSVAACVACSGVLATAIARDSARLFVAFVIARSDAAPMTPIAVRNSRRPTCLELLLTGWAALICMG